MESHLLQMRGLKQKVQMRIVDLRKSHLLQMRGLKQEGEWSIDRCFFVASFTDAWIETFCIIVSFEIVRVASFTDAWIETLNLAVTVQTGRRIFYRCVD